MLQFINIETVDGVTEEKVRRVLRDLHERFLRWLKDVYVSKDTVTLCYNINSPTERFLLKDITPLLEKEGLPTEVTIEKVRPGVLHPSAVDFLNREIRSRVDEDGYISDITWLDDNCAPFLAYLSQYQFIRDDWNSEVIGFDDKNSKVWCKRWIVGIALTEAAGDELLRRWS